MAQLNREVLVKKYGIDNLFNLSHIDLIRCQIRYIDLYTFKGLTKLEGLWLYENSIEEIYVRSFESLSNLRELDLQYNKLKRIESNTFIGLIKLEKLWLYENEIEEIEERSFESLSNLKVLYLNNNKLKSFHFNTFKCLTKLEQLWLSGNEIDDIEFESLSNLKELDLQYNKLKRIETNTFKCLTQLETLYLSNNQIEEIDVSSFESLSNLKNLFLSNNKLKEIDPKCFELLASIEVIEIYENVGLKAASFIKPSTKSWYNNDNVKKYGSISEWNKFLQQFPQLEQDLYIGLLLNSRYEVKRKIGSGAFGSVYLVDDTKIGIKEVKEKAMKIMDQLDSVTENEIDLLSEINHDNILKYFDHFHKKIGGEYKTFLITEYCQNGDLRTKIKRTKRLNRNFDDIQILNWMTQSTNALKYLHSVLIIHRDIKPANMFLNGRNEIKIGDLGISKIMEKTHASTYVGTKEYMSPEVFKAQVSDIKYYPNTDIWSLGCVLYELIFLTKAFPIGQRNDPPIPTNVSSSLVFSSVLSKMLEKDCLVRITSQQLLIELENLYNEFMI